MSELLSGLIGAIIATLFSLLYFYISEQKKFRMDVMLEVVSYCDDIYTRLRELHIQKDAEYSNQKAYLTPDEYRTISRELTTLLVSSSTKAKITLIYGEGGVLGVFNDLCKQFIGVSRILRKATQSAWQIEKENILGLFENKIDPMRAMTERLLIEGSRPAAIIDGWFEQYMPPFYKLVQRRKTKAKEKKESND